LGDRRFTLVGGRVPEQYLIIGAVVISTFFIGFGGGVIFPILPNLGDVIGITPFAVGIILSANRFSRLFANAPAGALTDRIGTRKPMVIGMAIQAGATSGYVIAMVAPFPEGWFFSARILWGIGSALVFATAYTIAADVSDSDSRGASMGLIRGGVIFGFPSGVVIGGVVSELAGNIPAFALATAFAILATLIAYAVIPETHVEEQTRTSVKPWDVDTGKVAVTVGLVNFAVLFVYIGALFASLVLFLDVRELSVFGMGPQGSSGIFMAVTVIAAGIFMFVGGHISDRADSRIPVLVTCLVVLCVGFVLLAYANSLLVLTIACLLIGAGQGGVSGPLMALLADLTPSDEVGRAVGTNNVLGDVGGGLGPVITLPIIDIIGFWPVYMVCAAIPAVAAIVLLGGVLQEKGSPTSH